MPGYSNGIATLYSKGIFNLNNVYNTGTIEGESKYNIYTTDSSCQVSNAYYKDDGTPASNVDTINNDETKVKAMSDDDMKNEQFAEELNDNASGIDLSELNDENLTGYNLREWIVKDNSYPTFE